MKYTHEPEKLIGSVDVLENQPDNASRPRVGFTWELLLVRLGRRSNGDCMIGGCNHNDVQVAGLLQASFLETISCFLRVGCKRLESSALAPIR